MMTKKDFISLADTIKGSALVEAWENSPVRDEVIDLLADWCATQNPRFDRKRWLGYINGTCGPSGGKVKPAPPRTPRA